MDDSSFREMISGTLTCRVDAGYVLNEWIRSCCWCEPVVIALFTKLKVFLLQSVTQGHFAWLQWPLSLYKMVSVLASQFLASLLYSTVVFLS